MNTTDFADRVCEYARTALAAKAKTKTVQFLLGAMTAGAGRRVLEEKIAAFAPFVTKPDGTLDLAALQESVLAGFDAAGTLPVAGGIISLDKADAEEFFAGVTADIASA